MEVENSGFSDFLFCLVCIFRERKIEESIGFLFVFFLLFCTIGEECGVRGPLASHVPLTRR